MRNQTRLLVILVTIVISSFSMACRIMPVAKATYVEGIITQDTDWTLVDSPFVLSNDVYVNPTVTLTIEPGVQVRFGNNFSLIVNGMIIAKGSVEDPIQFTSNKLEPDNGDWGAIVIDGSTQSSFTNCIIEYGTTGIALENGTLEVQDCLIASNSENGIAIYNGYMIVRNNQIINNTVAGISIAGGSQVIIENNLVSSNGDGIVLSGYLTGTIDIHLNDISANKQSGVVLSSNAYGTYQISGNTVSSNLNGFLVMNETSTYIFRNYIWNNTVGIYYESGMNHEAHFNDIYDNTLGMDVSSNATVSATQNYWGHRSGPLHASLNPKGEGNQVGGNGTNLDFIFFLTAPFDYPNALPTAVLWTDKTLVAPGQEVTFIGTDSYDDGRVDKFLFDFGDGTNTGWITLSIFNHTYLSTGTYQASLLVTDDFDTISDNYAVATIDVWSLVAPSVSIALSSATIDYNDNAAVTVQVSDTIGVIENAYVTLFSVRGGSLEPASGQTDTSGQFTATFTPPSVTEISEIRIIARATMTGYADGSSYQYLTVLPPLTIQIEPDPPAVKSGETATILVRVLDGLQKPVPDAFLSLSSDNGAISPNSAYTNLNGEAVFNFTTPYTSVQMSITLAATATKSGFTDGFAYSNIVVNPRNMEVTVEASSSFILSRDSVPITVHVTSDSLPVVGAQVTVSADQGNFTDTTELTGSDGNCTFMFNAPKTTTAQLNVSVTARVAKNGYANAENYTEIIVSPEDESGGWFPMLAIILILIPVVIAIILVILVKLKVITISTKEETQET